MMWACSTKSLTAICLARLADRGLLDYKQRIAHYWPEFGQRGKVGHVDAKPCDDFDIL